MRPLLRHIVRLLLVSVFLLSSVTLAQGAPAWEKVSNMTSELVESSGPDNYEVKVVDRMIVLTVARESNVKLFTILGQLVADQRLEAGTWRLPVSARGIYILKVGSATRRITL